MTLGELISATQPSDDFLKRLTGKEELVIHHRPPGWRPGDMEDVLRVTSARKIGDAIVLVVEDTPCPRCGK